MVATGFEGATIPRTFTVVYGVISFLSTLTVVYGKTCLIRSFLPMFVSFSASFGLPRTYRRQLLEEL